MYRTVVYTVYPCVIEIARMDYGRYYVYVHVQCICSLAYLKSLI